MSPVERRSLTYVVACTLSFVIYAAFLSQGQLLLFSAFVLPRVSLILGAAVVSILFFVFRPLLGRCRNCFDAAVAGMLPAVTFTLLSAAGKSWSAVFIATAICVLLFCCLRALFLAAAGYPRTLTTTRRCTSIALSFITPLIAVTAFCGAVLCIIPDNAGIQQAVELPVERTRTEIIADYAGELRGFESGNWDTLSAEEKLNLLRKTAALESEWLGIDPPGILTGKLDDSVIGQYSCDEKAIYIDDETLSSPPLACISTLLHELRHAYQFEVVIAIDWDSPAARDNLYWSEARRWRAEQLNYINGSEEAYSDYYSQSIEADARAYAETNIYDYIDFVNAAA